VAVAQKLHGPILTLGGYACTKTIATCGLRPKQHQRLPALLGFVNSGHVDSCNNITKDQVKEFRTMAAPFGSNSYHWRLAHFDGFCLPTTCGYQSLYKDVTERLSMQQYFSLDGLGLAMPLVDGIDLV
jgi:hypothetical protein